VNEQIEILNNRIKEFLDTLGVDHEYVDAYPLFLRADYEIRQDLFSDGLHPSQEGYELLSQIVGGKI
jgi:lysophospholipase L1-like esterase